MSSQSSVSSAEQQLGASGQGPNRAQMNATPNSESQKNSLKRSFPVSPESESDLSHNISPTGSPNRAGKQNIVNSAPPEGVNEELWEMLLSIKRDTTKANDLAGALDDRLLILEDSHDHAGADMLRMKHTLAEVVESNKVLAGRLMRAETTIERQREEITEIRMRSMRDNIIVRTQGAEYKEVSNENTASVFKRFMAKEMHVPDADKLCITRAHRMGQSNERNNRMMIAKVAFDGDQKRIFDNASSLRNTNFSVMKQIPHEIEERRQFAWQDYKKARGAKLPASFVGGRLIVSGRAVDKFCPVSLPTKSDVLSGGSATPMGPVSDVVGVDRHEFVACAAEVCTLQGVRDGLDTALKHEVFSKATHLPYAFRYQDDGGNLHENFHSDDDSGAGLQMLRALQSCDIMNVAVYVAHLTADNPLPFKRKSDALKEVVLKAVKND